MQFVCFVGYCFGTAIRKSTFACMRIIPELCRCINGRGTRNDITMT